MMGMEYLWQAVWTDCDGWFPNPGQDQSGLARIHQPLDRLIF